MILDWNNWMNQIKELYNKAIEVVDEDYMKQNFESQIATTRLLLEMHHLIKPEGYVVYFDEKIK